MIKAIRKINSSGLKLIQEFEGLRLTAYADIGGVPTIGWGNTNSVTKTDVAKKKTITKVEAERLLKTDVSTFEKSVDSLVKVPLTDNQFAALVSFSFNIGTGAFGKSTLLKLLNASDYKGAAAQFARWNKVNTKTVAGLTRRRAAERALFEAVPATNLLDEPPAAVCK